MMRRRHWIVLVCLFVLSLPAVTPRIYSSDEIQYFAYLRSLWFDHDVSFENEYQYFYDRGIARSEGFHETFLERRTETGRRINFGTIGCAILWSPFYAVGDAAARAMDAPRDGFSKPYVAAIAYGSAVYGFLALVLAVRAAERMGLNGFAGALATWLGTPLLFYMYVAPPFSHACSAFAVALFIYTWLRVRDRWTAIGFLALGASGALMAIVREQDLFFVAGPVVDFAVALFAATAPLQLLARALTSVVSFALVFTPQALAYLRLNGRIGPSQLVVRKMYWSAPHGLQVLFSPEHGFFWWTPFALVAVAGFAFLIRSRDVRRVAVCMLLQVALQVYIGGSVDSWTVAGGYGQRRFVALSALFVIGYAGLQSGMHAAAMRRMLAVVTVLAVYWNVALVAEFATGLMDRQRLEPVRNARAAFVTLPRTAPSLAYRYLFDRSSFYQHADSVPR